MGVILPSARRTFAEGRSFLLWSRWLSGEESLGKKTQPIFYLPIGEKKGAKSGPKKTATKKVGGSLTKKGGKKQWEPINPQRGEGSTGISSRDPRPSREKGLNAGPWRGRGDVV